MKKIALALLVTLTVTTVTNAQLRKIPAKVTEAFKAQFITTEQLEWKDNLTNFEAIFSQGGVNKSAKYTKEGTWVETTSIIAFEGLSAGIKEGFEKSKYATWEVKTVSIIEQPNKVVMYKVFVKKDEIQKRNLFFNRNGQLLKDNITI
jgi:hypothetical protein